MERMRYYILFFIGFFLVQSCVNQEDDIFEKSGAERLNEAQKYYEKILTGAPNGWVLEYIAGDTDETRRGAFNYLLKFENGQVTASVDALAMSDIAPANTNPYEKKTSLYRFDQDMSVTLSFSSYNSFLHYYHEQHGSYTTYKGDFEFTIMEASDDLVVLRGKKYGNIMEMHRLPEAVTWEEYIEDINNVIDETIIYSMFELQDNGEIVAEGEKNANHRYIFTLNDNETIASNVINTREGIKFIDPLEVNGKKVQNFVWDTVDRIYKCQDLGAESITIVTIVDPSYMYYEDIIGTYEFSYISDAVASGVPKTRIVTIAKDVEGVSFIMTGGFDWPIKLGYNRFGGYFTLNYQQVATSSGSPVVLWGFNGATSLYEGAILAGIFNGNAENPLIYVVETAGTSAIGFAIIMRVADSNYLVRDSGGDYAFNNIVMKRITP